MASAASTQGVTQTSWRVNLDNRNSRLRGLKAQSPDCKKFRNGSFKMESNGITSFIERKGKRQSERSPVRPGTFHFKVRWINDCTYTLVPTKETMKETLFRDLPKNAMLTVTITEVKENSYIQTSTANFADMALTGEVFSIRWALLQRRSLTCMSAIKTLPCSRSRNPSSILISITKNNCPYNIQFTIFTALLYHHDHGPYEHQSFDKIDLSEQSVFKQDYQNCTFINCNLSKANFMNGSFIDCEFKDCNLSLIQFNNTGLKNVHFKGCKLAGINFSHCNDFLFQVSFTNCQLDYCTFFKKKMTKTPFIGCSMKEMQFENVDLSQALFKDCNLMEASFVNTILEKADFRTASYYSIDPELNKMKKAKFSHEGIAGLLGKYGLDIDF